MTPPRDYLDASAERLRAAYEAYRLGMHVESLYLAGVAVECILRSYLNPNEKFDERHNLDGLWAASKIVDRFSGSQSVEMVAALQEVWTRWKNNLRYLPSRRVTKNAKKLARNYRVKGDVLKHEAKITYENAAALVQKGAIKWTLTI